jgi:hypothetical protein
MSALEEVLKEINAKNVWKINHFINALDIPLEPRQRLHIKFIDICLNPDRTPFMIYLTYDNEEFNDIRSFKGSQLPHKLLVFKKDPLPIPLGTEKIILRKNKFTGALVLHELIE